MAVLHNGASIWSRTLSSYGQRYTFTLSVSVLAGDTIDVATATGSTWTNLSTALRASITG